MALQYGIWRGRRTVEPPIGKRLHFTSARPKRASSPATRMSVQVRISVPPATQKPLHRGDDRLRHLEVPQQALVDDA